MGSDCKRQVEERRQCRVDTVFSSTSRGERGCRGGGSEGLNNDGVQQGHVLGSPDRQLVRGVVVDDLGDGGEGRAVLPQHEAAVSRLAELHVHEALAAPDTQSGGRVMRC